MGRTDEHNRAHLDLDTCKMNPIDNYQTDELTNLDWGGAADKVKEYRHKFASFVGEPSPKYNCHGLTFGSRRTQVDGETKTILWILDEDGYQELTEDKPQSGDVVVYFDENGQVIHSGIILYLIDGIPKIWSKWGKGHEVVHSVADCPYGQQVKYFRIRPWQRKHRV
jgi:hypothetical protein